MAGTLISASLAGVDSHGIIRMERYIGGIEEGSVRPRQKHEVRIKTQVRELLLFPGPGLCQDLLLSLRPCSCGAA